MKCLFFKGHIKFADEKFLNIFGYMNQPGSIIGKDINELIPSLKLPMCGLTKVGAIDVPFLPVPYLIPTLILFF